MLALLGQGCLWMNKAERRGQPMACSRSTDQQNQPGGCVRDKHGGLCTVKNTQMVKSMPLDIKQHLMSFRSG
jgi:hypothetical protein